jgi:hypothetical protein
VGGLEILQLIRHDLQRAVVRRGDPPIFRPIDASPWLAMSILQKAVRRGREELALTAAATLLRLLKGSGDALAASPTRTSGWRTSNS